MIVCICKGIRCAAVRSAVRAGAATVDEVGEACEAGTDCGGCRDSIQDLIDEVTESSRCASTGRPGVRLPIARPAA